LGDRQLFRSEIDAVVQILSRLFEFGGGVLLRLAVLRLARAVWQ
jgi:hypothetical protein